MLLSDNILHHYTTQCSALGPSLLVEHGDSGCCGLNRLRHPCHRKVPLHMTAQYTYLATDLVTDTVIGELPVNNVSLDCQLNSAGHMSSGLKLDDPRIDNNELLARTTPGKTAFWAYRENTIVWGGIVLTREYQSDGKSLSLTGQTFECYPFRRFPRSILGTSTMNYSLGQGSTIDALWQLMQSAPQTSINVQRATL